MPIITKRHAFQKLWARNWISNVWNISMWFNIKQKYLLGSNDISTFTILWNSPALIRRGTYPGDHESMQTPHIPACSTAAPSPVLLQSPQISCSALSSVWHIWYLANSAVILQWIDSVPSAQCPVCDAVQCFETFSKTFLAALAGRRGGRGAAADRQ